MKWGAIGLGAAVLALAVGAFALTTRGVGQGTREIVTTTETSPSGALTPTMTANPVSPVSAAKKPARVGVGPCKSDGTEDSDPTGDDSSNAREAGGVCGSDRESENSGDNEAGDNRDDEAGNEGSDD
jgi:hypothetical protein